MSKVGLNLKIDVTKIDKSKLFEGKKGKYLDAQVFVNLTELSEYGDNGMITQAVSKEDREKGAKGAILGNCKVFWRDNSATQNNPPEPQDEPFSDDIPF